MDFSEISNNLLRDVKGEYLTKGTEKCKFLRKFLDKEVKNLDDHGCPKVQHLVDEEM